MDERILSLVIMGITFLFILILQLILPRLSRRNIFMGVRLPGNLEDEELDIIYRAYIRENIFFGGLGLLILLYISYGYYDLYWLIFLSILAYLGLLFLIYVRANRRVKALKEERGWEKEADTISLIDLDYRLERKPQSFLSWGRWSLFILFLNIVLTLVSYDSLGDRIGSHWNMAGQVDGYMSKTAFNAMLINIIHLATIVIIYPAYLSIYKARHEIDRENPELSIERHRVFIRSWSIFLSFTLYGMQFIFSYINLAAMELIDSTVYMLPISLVYTGLILVWSLYLSIKLGQGGERLDLGEDSGSRSYGIEDDDRWILANTIYYNKEDPSIFVEKRFGIGWTINMARPLAKLFISIVLVLIILSFYFIR